jgi:toxin-antitoxin system PIN domain toxin
MIAVDTNLLVHAHRADSPWNEQAYASISRLASSARSWAIPWPCLHEFIAVVTHPRIYRPPSTASQACEQCQAWLESPGLVLLGEHDAYWPVLRKLVEAGHVTGPRVHDARIAALCLSHDVDELWTADRDFGRFPELKTRNPMTHSAK